MKRNLKNIASFKKGQSGIYLIQFDNGRYKYVGSAECLNKRISNHLSDLRKKTHCNKKMQNVYNKHFESINISLIEFTSISNLTEREQFSIDTLTPNLNIVLIAGRTLGYKHTDEAKAKMSFLSKERSTNQNWLTAVSKTWFKKGKAVTDEEKEILRERMKTNNPFKGKKHTDQTKEKMRRAASLREPGNYSKKFIGIGAAASRKPISQLTTDGELVNTYNSITEAININGWNKPKIGACIKTGKVCKGFVWVYSNNEKTTKNAQ